MIEKLKPQDPYTPHAVFNKFNELIEASNRQDRLLASLHLEHLKASARLTHEDRCYWADAFEAIVNG